jgi:hypothetical protein
MTQHLAVGDTVLVPNLFDVDDLQMHRSGTQRPGINQVLAGYPSSDVAIYDILHALDPTLTLGQGLVIRLLVYISVYCQ